MTRFVLCGLLTFGVLGCGDGQPPAMPAKPIAPDGPPGQVDDPPVSGPKPDATSPPAAAGINAILMAHTSSQPSLIDRLRKVRTKRSGESRMQGGTSPSKMELCLWGDQTRWSYFLEAQSPKPYVFSLRGSTGWHQLPGAEKPMPLTEADLALVLPDVRAERLGLLVPLTSDKTTADLVRPATPKAGSILRVWHQDWPPMLVHTDPTNRLAKISYEARELGRVVTRQVLFSDYEAVNGVLLPKKVEYLGAAATSWTKTEYEVPGLFELDYFDK
jgi:hypothetical protein